MRASSGALRQCTRRQPLSTHFMPIAWHYISGQFSIPAPRKPQKSAIFLPQPPPKLFNFSLRIRSEKSCVISVGCDSVAVPAATESRDPADEEGVGVVGAAFAGQRDCGDWPHRGSCPARNSTLGAGCGKNRDRLDAIFLLVGLQPRPLTIAGICFPPGGTWERGGAFRDARDRSRLRLTRASTRCEGSSI